MNDKRNIKIFSGSADDEFARTIAEKLGSSLGSAVVGAFSDGEVCLSIEESVRGVDLFVVQSLCEPVNDRLMQLLIMIDAFKRASAGRITAVIPYFGYARQDRKAKSRDAISAKLVADLIQVAGAHRVLTMDLHAPQLQGFFNIPVDNLTGIPVLASYFQRKFERGKDDVVIASPDLGSVPRTREFSKRMDFPVAIVEKRRPKANVSEVMNIIGNVQNKKVILVDDLVDTAGTLCNAAEAMVKIGGASEVYACATHGVLSGPAIERIGKSCIKELVVLNTIPIHEHKRIDKVRVLPVAPVFAEAIERIYEEVSISTLFV